MGLVAQWQARYSPGEWLLLCGPTSLVVLEPATGEASTSVSALWKEVVAASSLADVAERLSTLRVASEPTFCAVFWFDGALTALLRGEVSLVDLATSQVVAEGAKVQTWNEVVLDQVERVGVQLPGGDLNAASPTLPLVVGAARVSRVMLDASSQATVTSPQVLESADIEPAPDLPTGASPDDRDPDKGVSQDGTGADLNPSSEDLADAAADTELMDLASLMTEPANPAPTEIENRDATSVDPLSAPAASADLSGPTVMATLCDRDHPNPPKSRFCRLCGAELSALSARSIPQPVLAILRATDGTRTELTGPVLIGRAPLPRGTEPRDPALMTVSSPGHDISRTHCRVAPSGWEIEVMDLGSTNGTVAVLPEGGGHRTLEAHTPMVLPVGTILELGEGSSVVVEDPSPDRA